VTICRRGVPVVEIVRTKKPTRKKRILGGPPRSDQNHRSRLVEADDRRRSGRLPFGATKKSCDYCWILRSSFTQFEFPEKLSRRALAALRNLDNAIELSAVSVTEIAIKAASGKLAFSAVILRKAMDDLGIRILPYTADHAFRMFGLPRHHGDPFDRQIVAQACARTFRL